MNIDIDSAITLELRDEKRKGFIKMLLSVVIPVFTTQERFALSKEFFNECEQYSVEFVFVLTSPECDEEFLMKSAKNVSHKIIKAMDSDPGVARNIGKRHASGEWIAFWDPDDRPIINAVMELLYTKKTNVCDIIVGQYELEDEKGILISKSKMQMQIDSEFARNTGLWRCIFRTKLASKIYFPSLSMAEDQIFLCEFDLDSVDIFFSNIVTYKYVKYPSGQLTKSKKALRDIPAAISMTKEVIDQKGPTNFRLICLYSQIISGLRRGSMITKFKTLKTLFEITFGINNLKLSTTIFGIFKCLMIGK